MIEKLSKSCPSLLALRHAHSPENGQLGSRDRYSLLSAVEMGLEARFFCRKHFEVENEEDCVFATLDRLGQVSLVPSRLVQMAHWRFKSGHPTVAGQSSVQMATSR
jgi:hypothetical protein